MNEKLSQIVSIAMKALLFGLIKEFYFDASKGKSLISGK